MPATVTPTLHGIALAPYEHHRDIEVRLRYKTLIALAAVVVTAGLLRVTLPLALKSYVNSSLAEMGPYSGRVMEVDVSLIRGAYTLYDLQAVQRGSEREIPFLDLPVMDISLIHESEEETAADIELTGRFMRQGAMTLAGSIDPNAMAPTFDLDFSLEGAPVTSANPWLREFLRVDARSGDFSMYLEAAAADGRFEGYLKPVMENLEIFRVESETEGPFRKAWEALVGFTSKIFQNRKEDQVATRIPYSGEFEDPDIGTLAAIVNLIRNAFVSALSQSLEGTVDLEDVAGTDGIDAEESDDSADSAEEPD